MVASGNCAPNGWHLEIFNLIEEDKGTLSSLRILFFFVEFYFNEMTNCRYIQLF